MNGKQREKKKRKKYSALRTEFKIKLGGRKGGRGLDKGREKKCAPLGWVVE